MGQVSTGLDCENAGDVRWRSTGLRARTDTRLQYLLDLGKRIFTQFCGFTGASFVFQSPAFFFFFLQPTLFFLRFAFFWVTKEGTAFEVGWQREEDRDRNMVETDRQKQKQKQKQRQRERQREKEE